MKKFFTLIAMTFIAAVGAKAVNLWTGSNALGNWDWDTRIAIDANSDILPGATLTITFTASSDAQFVLKSTTDWNNPLIGAGYCNVSSDATTYSLVLTGKQVAVIKESGFGIQGKNMTVTSVDYENPATAADENSIWIGSFASSWSVAETISKSYFANAQVGDKIRILITDASDPNATLKWQNSSNNYSWDDFADLNTTKETSADKVEWTLTSDALTTLASYNLLVTGPGFTMTEVQLISATPSDPTLLWSSETATAIGWNDNIKVSAAKFTASGAKVGDFIKIKVSDFAEGHQLSVYTDWEVIYGHKGLFVNGDTEYVLGITKTIFDAMTAKGFFVAGSGLNVSEVRLVEGDVVADEVMWFGSFVMNGNNFMELSGMTIPDAAKSIEVEFDGGGEGSWMAFKATTDGWPILETKKIIGNSVIKFAVTEEMRATIGYIVLQGDKYTVKSIKYSTEELKDVYSVIGTLSGNWDTDTDMTLGADGKYSVTFAGLAAGNYEFKIRVNNSWDENYGLDGQKDGENVKITVETAGDVTIFFDPETKAITYTGAVPYQTPAAATYSVIGTINGNWDTDTEMTLGTDGKYSVTFAGLAAGNYEFKIRVNNSWDENYGLDGQKDGENVKITVETAGDVTIFFDPETKQITYTGAIATGISTINAAKEQSGVRYNLAGQKVDASYKGVVIVNGRKMVQK